MEEGTEFQITGATVTVWN